MKRIIQYLTILCLLIAFLIGMTGCASTPVPTPTATPTDTPTQTPSPTPIPPSPTLTPTQPKLEVAIEVVDVGGNPIPRAAVRVSFADQPEGQAGWTDESGFIRFMDIYGVPLTISVQAVGFFHQKTNLDSLPGASPVRVTLEADPQAVDPCVPDDVYATARYMKMDLYNSIDYQPEIVVLGSSRAYTIDPQYLEQIIGRKVFNMALNFGSMLDNYYYARYVFAHQSKHPPRLLLIEAQINTINQLVLAGVTPIELWKMLPEEEAFQPEIDLCDHIFNQDLNQKYIDRVLSSSGLLWAFQPDGMAVHRPINYRQYQVALQRQIPSLRERALCESITPVGLEYVQKIIDLAAQQNTSVIFFRPPFQGDLYNQLRDDARYKKCSNLLNDFMLDMVSQNSQVYFHDFSGYEPITTLDFDGFYDGQHFKPEASNQIIDLLLQDIEAALSD